MSGQEIERKEHLDKTRGYSEIDKKCNCFSLRTSESYAHFCYDSIRRRSRSRGIVKGHIRCIVEIMILVRLFFDFMMKN